MIRLGLSDFLALYLFLIVGLILILWWRSYSGRGTAKDRFNATEFIQRCPYCGHVLLDYRELELIQCPLCKSYFEGR